MSYFLGCPIYPAIYPKDTQTSPIKIPAKKMDALLFALIFCRFIQAHWVYYLSPSYFPR